MCMEWDFNQNEKSLEAPNESWGLPAEKHCFTQQMNNILFLFQFKN